MTRALACEWGDRGIRVNAVAPTFVRTRLTQALLDDAQAIAAIERDTPLGPPRHARGCGGGDRLPGLAGRGHGHGPYPAGWTVAGSRAERPAATAGPDEAKGERIAKVMARAGLCSRREAERWIVEGRVKVDGAVIATPAVIVGARGRASRSTASPCRRPRPRACGAITSRAGLVTTDRDPQGRRTIFDALPPELPRVITIGRLDLSSEGLLLLTNDGAIARHLELPATGWKRRYRVRVHGTPDEGRLAALAGGVTVSGLRYGPIEARLDKVQGANAWLTMTLVEGRNREVRRGVRASRPRGEPPHPHGLWPLPSSATSRAGAVAEVPRRVLREQLGARLEPTPSARARRANRRR